MDKQLQDINGDRPKAKNRLGERLHALRKRRKLSQRQIADMVGVSSVTVSLWESSDSQPRGPSLIALSLALGCTLAYLLYGSDSEIVDPLPPGMPYTPYPLLSSLQASTWNDAVCTTWILSNAPLAGAGFWLSIGNNAMASLSGLSVGEGSLVLFDTERISVVGDLVLVLPKGRREPTFRQLVHDSGIQYLRALNHEWPVHFLDKEDKLIGVAVESRQSLGH